MGDMRVGLSLLQAFMPAAPEFKLPHKTAEEFSQPEDPVLGALEWQLHQVAQRRQSEQVGFDVQEVASELRGRMTGLVLNLWSPSTGLAACLAALQPHELEDLLTASCADGGSAIADIELDADTVEVLKAALIHCRDDIARLTVRRPAEGSDPDFQGIQDAMGLPQIHFVSADSPARGPLLELLRKVASRSEPHETGIDVEQAATDLQGRIAKSRLDLTSLSPQLEHCLGAFEPEDADALLKVGITRVEMDSGFFRIAEPALMRNAAHLESVTVRVPARCSEPDVSGLLGQNSSLQINVLRDKGDVDLADESVAQAAFHAAVAARVRADEELRGDLLYVLGTVAAGDPARFNQGEIHAVAQAVMDCASLDVTSGKFGWDLHGKLPAACVPWLQARGIELFTALQNAAERAGTGSDWVDLHDDFVIDPDLVARLSALAPISKLIVSAPANGVFINLGKLDDGALLKELVIRNADDKKLMITVPHSVTTIRSYASEEVTEQDWMVAKGTASEVERLRCTLGLHFATMENRPAKPKVVVQAILDCARFDQDGNFGWDFNRLPAEHVQWLQSMPAPVFAALQACGEDAGTGTTWLNLPDTIVMDSEFMVKLAILNPLSKLSVPAPSLGILMDLRTLRRLETLEIRFRDRPLRVNVPSTLKNVLAAGANSAALLARTTFSYWNEEGKKIQSPAQRGRYPRL